jgi:DNA helicase-2/ATP-dependent DNA helicase PcrA
MFSQDSGRVGADDRGRRTFGDIAVLYRLNALQGPLCEAFDRSGIPFQVSGEAPLAKEPMVAELLTCLRLGVGRKVQAEAAGQVLRRLMPGFGEKSARRYAAQAGPERSLADIAVGLPSRLSAPLQELRAGLKRLGGAARQSMSGALAIAAALGWWDVQRVLGQGQAIWHRLERLSAASTGLDDFLDTLLTGRAEDLHDSRAERVALMTLHAAKGLEFAVVFVVGCEEHLLPLDLEGRRGEPAEERRLFYVAMSRARECLYLVRARRRLLHGMRHENKPSRFLADIEEQLKQYDRAGLGRGRASRRIPASAPAQLSLFA